MTADAPAISEKARAYGQDRKRPIRHRIYLVLLRRWDSLSARNKSQRSSGMLGIVNHRIWRQSHIFCASSRSEYVMAPYTRIYPQN